MPKNTSAISLSSIKIKLKNSREAMTNKNRSIKKKGKKMLLEQTAVQAEIELSFYSDMIILQNKPVLKE